MESAGAQALNFPLVEFAAAPPPAAHPEGSRRFPARRWINSFAQLPDGFYTRMRPDPLPDPYLVGVSEPALQSLGLDPEAACTDEFLSIFSGSRVPEGADPLAAVYSGHQFGVYVPQLGDGRAILLGGVQGVDRGEHEVQLKGSGRTPYSRMGDGRAVLRSSIREFLACEAMHALGIPTTRALAVVGSDAPVVRETVETAAIVTRVAPTFLRFGSFEYFFWQKRHTQLRQLADYAIAAFYPQCLEASRPYLELLVQVARRTARLIASWQAVGFCHGVMNTDNLSIVGLTIDYGPFGFMDAFDTDHVCNHSDESGRYAFSRQPAVAHWNLRCLGQALLPLTGNAEQTLWAVDLFWDEFALATMQQMRGKLGLTLPGEHDAALVQQTLGLLDRQRVDWTSFWRRLSTPDGVSTDAASGSPLRELFGEPADLDAWMVHYRDRLAREPGTAVERTARMNAVNPKFVLRNHLAERAISQARGDQGERDFSELERLLQCLQRPYDEQPQFEHYALPPPAGLCAVQPSCSS
jgi:uncharacterized protein YdiU (UPF0061 family)